MVKYTKTGERNIINTHYKKPRGSRYSAEVSKLITVRPILIIFLILAAHCTLMTVYFSWFIVDRYL